MALWSRTRGVVAAFVAAGVLSLVDCALNPQPHPPGDEGLISGTGDDSGTRGPMGGSGSGSGSGSNSGGSTGGTFPGSGADAAVFGSADAAAADSAIDASMLGAGDAGVRDGGQDAADGNVEAPTGDGAPLSEAGADSSAAD